MNVFELFGTIGLKGTDKVGQELSGLEKRTQQVQKGMKIMGAAFTAVGAAGLAMIQSSKKINAELGVTALSLGITTKEMRDLALTTTNVTFPIKEVTATFDLLARAGIKDQEVLKSTATAFDTLGDAIGIGASQVTEIMVPAMKTFRLSAEEIAGKTDMMTYMVRNSTIGLEDFNRMVGYTSQDMVDAGLTIDDMAAAMMYMSDNGVEPGKVMLREWNKAVTESEKEGIALTEALGMTTEELERYKSGLEGATGMTQEYADVANEQYTIMDKAKQKWSELTLGASGFLEPLEPVLAGMTALGPMMIILSSSAGTAAIKWGLHTVALIAHKIASIASAVAIKAVTAAQWLWNAAMTANPIGLIVVAIGALIAAGVLLWKNWGKVADFFKKMWINLKIMFLTGVEKLLGILAKFTGWLPWLGDKVQAAHDKIAAMIDAEKIKRDAGETKKALEDVTEALEDTTEIVAEHTDATEIDSEALATNVVQLEEQKEALEDQQKAYENTLEKIRDVAEGMAYERSEAGKLDITIDDLVETMLDMGKSEEQIADGLIRMGEEGDNVNTVMTYFGITTQNVTSYQEKQAIATKKVTDALGEQVDAIEELDTAEQARLERVHMERPAGLIEGTPEHDAWLLARYGPSHEVGGVSSVVAGGAKSGATWAPEPDISAAAMEAYHNLLAQKDVAEAFHASGDMEGYREAFKEVERLRLIYSSLYEASRGRIQPMDTGGIFTKPTLAALAMNSRPEAVLPLDRLPIGNTNNFYIDQMVVRREGDIQKIARELLRLQQSKMRSVGVA